MSATRRTLLCLLLAGLAAGPGPASAEPSARQKRKQLQSIHRELDEKRKEIEEYKKREESLAAELKGLKSQLAASRARRERVRVLLRSAERHRRELERETSRLRLAERSLDQGLASALQEYGAVHAVSSPYYGSDELWAQALIERSVSQDAVFLERMKGVESAAEKQARDMLEQRDALRRQSRSTEREQGSRSGELAEKARALGEARAARDRALARVHELEESERAMSRLIADLGRKAPKAQPASGGSLSRHTLPWPAQGRVVSGFGRRRVPGLRTWTVQHGIELAAPLGAPVRSVRAGQVIFAGPFRSYGQVLIVDHGGQLFSLYGRLGTLAKAKGSAVAAGEIVGTAGESDGKRGLYFELRRSGDPLDPVAWLKRK